MRPFTLDEEKHLLRNRMLILESRANELFDDAIEDYKMNEGEAAVILSKLHDALRHVAEYSEDALNRNFN